MSEQPVELRLERIKLREDAPPYPAHKFFYTRVGPDILLEIGHFDLVELRSALEESRESGERSDVKIFISDSFSLSPQAAFELMQMAQRLVDDLKSQGYLPLEK